MDGRPPGNTGCCRLFFFFFGLPSPLAPAPHPRKPHLPLAPRTPPRSERSPAFQPLAGWVAGAPTPAADLGCLRAAREPLRIRLPGNQRTGEGGGWRGCSLSGAPLAGLRHFRAGPRPQPRPQPHHQRHPRRQPLGLLQACAQHTHTTTALTHTHTQHSLSHTHTHTHTPAPEKGQEPETTGKGDGERGRERQTARGPHRLPKPRPPHPAPSILGSPRPPVDQTPTVAHRHTHTHALTRSASGLGAGAGSRLRWPSRRGPLRPRMRGSLGVPTGDCQPQGTAPSRGPPAQG